MLKSKWFKVIAYSVVMLTILALWIVPAFLPKDSAGLSKPASRAAMSDNSEPMEAFNVPAPEKAEQIVEAMAAVEAEVPVPVEMSEDMEETVQNLADADEVAEEVAPVAGSPASQEVVASAAPTSTVTLTQASVRPDGHVLATMSDGSTVNVDVATMWESYPTPAHMYENQNALVKENPRPEAPYEPLEYVVDSGQTIVFFNEGQFELPDGTVVIAVGGRGRENLSVITNAGTAPVKVVQTGYAPSGFSVWTFPKGYTANVELLARYSLGRYSHCGIAEGCQVVFLRQYSWNGAKATETRNDELTEPMVIDNPTTFVDNHTNWASETAGVALQHEHALLDQAPFELGANATPATAIGKAQIVFLSAGELTLLGGETVKLDAKNGTLYMVVLLNEVGDATSFVTFEEMTKGQMLEYHSGQAPHADLWASAQIGTNGVDNVVVYVVRYTVDGINVTAQADAAYNVTTPLNK
ncbi:hypothetical protein A2415_02255 [candidate division WWE3 bacterium RIFOXYC1_FULL_39_7]|uniref:Uncharacterized protein n=1 Tax=candidate division WWE3 bacterium RIFOXYC1_FULL_39_7 TaxID=1802643 RepID=A0A1F4WH07_UNCKA|nr:MAG: hypothetical protein A2415_02255 [candidate division WWE3 bacterium RIFOXYC1_FULL_39_7]